MSIDMTAEAAETLVETQAEPIVATGEKGLGPAELETKDPPPEVTETAPAKLVIGGPIQVKELAARLSLSVPQLITKLIAKGIFANINQTISFEIARDVAQDFGFVVEEPKAVEEDRRKIGFAMGDSAGLVHRPPIVTLMGHVDHGKTSLLDAIRHTDAASREAGGITQHIGAYEVFLKHGAVTFLDTPGHEAFTSMRARGAKVTDVVVLVVAADDGIMPQTEEAIDHARAAEAPIVVAINKIDLPTAHVERVKKGLMERGLTPEDWGGKTITVGVSAKTGQGIPELLEMLLLEAELLELKANPSVPAQGAVIEATLSEKSGPVATILVQQGTLRVADIVVSHHYYGRVRAMINDRGQRVQESPPSMPVKILGFSGVPHAGDVFEVVPTEARARELIEARKTEALERGMAGHITLEELYHEVKAGKVNILKLIVKADVQGSVEVLKQMLFSIRSEEVKLQIIHSGIGPVTESDVMLAAASNAIVIGFHVDVSSEVRDVIKEEQVDVRLYEIIYEVKSSIEKALEGLLEPESKEVFLGRAEVRQVFKIAKTGAVAGSMVLDGKMTRTASCKVIRDGKVIHRGKIVGLKRFKDDAREVAKGFECGISVSDYKDIAVGDRIEVFEIQYQARTLR